MNTSIQITILLALDISKGVSDMTMKIRGLIGCACLLLLQACAMHPMTTDALPPLKSGEGIAGISFVSMLPLSKVRFYDAAGNQKLLIDHVPPGQSAFLFVVPAGRYCIERYTIDEYGAIIETPPDDRCFDVEAGKLSYSGTFVPNFTPGETAGTAPYLPGMKRENRPRAFLNALSLSYPHIAAAAFPTGSERSVAELALPGSWPTNSDQRPHVSKNGNVTNYEMPGNLASSHSAPCVGIESASNTWTPADLYPAIAICVHQGDYEKSVELFILAGSYSRFDTMRVTDQSSWDAATVLKMQTMSDFAPKQQADFEKAAQPMFDDPSRVCAKLKTLGAPDYIPAYMIQHGMNAFLGSQPNGGLEKNFDAKAAWTKVLHNYVHCK